MSQKIYTDLDIKGNTTIGSIANATTDTDKFLVSDNGLVKYRTGAEMLSDLGVAPGVASNVQHQVKAEVAINKGQAVYVTSADGTNMIVGLASNTSEATSSKTMGLLDSTVAINGFANVITEGLLAGLNTIGATAGDPVWLGTDGNLIYGLINKPSAPAHLVFIGIVTRVNASNGEIFVKVQNGFELNEIHDVDLKTTTPVNGDILGFNGTLWVNKTIAAWLGYTPANASGTTNYVSKFTGSGTLGNSQIFDNGTNIGIGTTSPSEALSISGTTKSILVENQGGATIGMTLKSTRSGWFQSINIFGGTSIANGQQVQFGQYDNGKMFFFNSGNFPIGFYTNGTEKLSITASGNVGIGTTSPTQKLEVVGGARITGESILGSTSGLAIIRGDNSNAGTGGAIQISSSNVTANQYIAFGSGLSGTGAFTERMRVLSTGNVGIGTTSPGARLVSLDTSNNISALFGGGATAPSWVAIGTVNSGTVPFIQGYNNTVTGTSNLCLNPNGSANVGIGTTSPTQKLDVTGNIKISNNNSLMFRNAANNADISIIQLTSTNQLNLGTTSSSVPSVIALHTNSTERMRITSGGEILIGGTFNPYSASNRGNITLNGSSSNIITFTNNSLVRGYLHHDDNNFEILNNVSGGAIISYTQSSERMRITASGNVGIGTSSPSAKLDVNGDVLINGLTVGRGGGSLSSNTTIGINALSSNSSGQNIIAVGRDAVKDLTNVDGLTVIGVDANRKPDLTDLESNSIAINQFNPDFGYGQQVPHFYAPDKIYCPINFVTNLLTIDYSVYTAAFLEYSIYNSGGDQFRAGRFVAAFKGTGTPVYQDYPEVVYNGTTLAATFTLTGGGGNNVIVQLENYDSDDYIVRFTSRLLMR